MTLAALAILGPLAAAALILVLRRWPALLALAGTSVGAVGALVTLARVADGERFDATLAGLPGYPLVLDADPLGALLSATVAVAAALILTYAVGYLAEEEDQPRFFAAMAFFVAAMQALVLAGDWLLLLAAWELIGLASYLLIGFWYGRPGVPAAATRAFATTRVADLGLYVGVFALVAETGTTRISVAGAVEGTAATIAGLALLLAAMAKSAQAPLQGWLLDAMAGPTPVSALLHSATLVVAGVVLLTRAFPLLPEGVLLVVGLVGGVTAIVTGLTAVAQGDLKRLLAASTSSQLGLMLLALGAGAPVAATVHLVANAAMKSSLFLGAGVFQHARGSTAFAELAGVGRMHRWPFAAFALAGLALAGLPPLAGFWSKDAVIAAALESDRAGLLAPLAVAATLLTGVYVARALRLLWRGPGAAPGEGGESGRGAGWMGVGLAVLAALAAGLGVAVAPIGELLDAEVPEDGAGVILGLVAAFAGLAAGWGVGSERRLGPVFDPALRGFRVDGGLDGFVARPALALGRAGARLDRGIHAVVLGVAARARGTAAGGQALDAGLHGVVEGVGRRAMATGAVARLTDEGGIDAMIAGLVDRTRRLGRQARALQSGLVHRELLLAAGGTAVVLLVVLLA